MPDSTLGDAAPMDAADVQPSPGRSHGYVYDAFASYTTAADYKLVRRVEAFLETFHKLPNPGKLQLPPLQLCVDGSDFSITRFRASLRVNRTALDSSQVSSEIERMVAEQLRNSARLLVFCPGLAKQGYWSSWEIQWFLANRSADDIYLVITQGRNPLRDPAAFFPPGVIAASLHTRIFYDLREQRWWRSWTWHGVRDFDEELARLAADLSGRSLGEVQPVWFRERRKTLRRIVTASVAVAVVTLLLAFYAWSQQQLAEQRRLVAERQTRVANIRQLAAQAGAALDQRLPQRSLLLAAEAMKMSDGIGEDPPVEAEQALRRTLANTGGQALGGHSRPVEIVAFSRNEHWLATAAEDHQLHLRDLHNLDHPNRLPVGGTVEKLLFSDDSHWLAAAVRDHAVLVWDLQSAALAGGVPVFTGRREEMDAVKLCFSPGGHWLAYSWSDGLVQVCNLQAPNAEPLSFDKHEGPANLLAFTPDETRLVTASDKETLNDQTFKMTKEVDALVWDLHLPDAAPQVLSGHQGAIKCLQFSPDGKLLFTGSTDNTVRIWDFAGRRAVFRTTLMGGHTKGIFRLASTPNGRYLVSGGHEGLACVWDVPASLSRHSAAAPKVLGGHAGAVTELQVSGDGRWLLTHGASDRDVQLWTMNTPEPAERHWTLRAHTALVEVAAFSEDSRWLLTSGDDKVARLWNLQREDPSDHSVTLAGHEDPVGAAAISSRSRWVVLASGSPLDTLPRCDASVRLWDLDQRQPVSSPEVFPGDGAGFGVQVSPDSRWIVMDAGENRLRLWKRRDRKLFLLGGHTDKISEKCFSPDGRWLATASEDGSGQLFDLRQDDPSTGSIRLHGHRGAVLHAAISPNSRWLATGDNEQTALLWDLRAPDPGAAGHVLPGHEDGITVLAWSPDSRRLLTGTSDRKAFVWDTSENAPPAAPLISLPEHEESLNLAAFSPDGRWLATAVLYRPTVMLWDLRRPEPAAEPLPLRDHETQVEQVLFSNDSHWLVTASGDADGKLYDLHSSSPLVHTLHAHTDKPNVACFRPDGSWLATGGADASIFLWDLTANSPESSPIKCGGHSDAVQELAFDANGRVLVSGGKDGTVRVWKLPAALRGGTPVVLIAASPEELGSVDLADGGESIITGTAEGAQVWPLSTARLTALAEATAARPLSPEEQALLTQAPPVQPTFLERLFSSWKQLRGSSRR